MKTPPTFSQSQIRRIRKQVYELTLFTPLHAASRRFTPDISTER
jgi:hypothetical protein